MSGAAPEAQQENTMEKKTDKQQTVFLGISVLGAGLGWLLAVVGTFTDDWVGVGRASRGLFCSESECPPGSNTNECYWYCPAYVVVKILIILGIILASAGILLIGGAILLLILKNKQMPLIPIAGGIACAVGGLCVLSGTILYRSNKVDDFMRNISCEDSEDKCDELEDKVADEIPYGWSIDVTTAGGVFLLLAGGLVVVGIIIMSMMRKR